MESNVPSRVRFAPSPTGALHIGGARTALYNWLDARGRGGVLVLRIEDTDRERSSPKNVEQILDALRWLELDWDEGPVSQAERAGRHREATEELVARGRAYRDPSSAEDVKRWKAEHGNRGYRGEASAAGEGAVRLRVPDDGETVVHDLIRGPVAFPNAALDDFVIARGDGTALYNLAVAVDDLDMGITRVIRGDDHLSNTPKQQLVLEALGATPPEYAHLPLLHGPDGKKLSKRHGAASVQELRRAGYLPAAVRNYIALLGWGAEDDATILSTDELVRRFSVERVGKASAVFDERKLRWLNGRYMRELALADYVEAARSFLAEHEPEAAGSGALEPEGQGLFRDACAAARDKAQTLAEVWPLVRFVFCEAADDEKAWRKVMKDGAREALAASHEALAASEPFSAERIEADLGAVAERLELKPGKLFQPIRVAITGTSVSPGIFESLALIGRERALERVESAIARLDLEAPS